MDSSANAANKDWRIKKLTLATIKYKPEDNG